MKKYAILLTALILAFAVFTGCGCRKNMPMDTKPTTEATTRPTTMPTTAPTTRPTETTTPTGETYDNGNGPLPYEDTGAADDTSHSRQFSDNTQK